MIRRSSAIAAVAVVLSLLAHFFGLSIAPMRQPEQSAAESTPDTVTLGNAFEDLIDAVSDPLQSEPAPAPEPPVETPPEPETADSPTSDAKVASSNPQRVFAPDTGTARTASPGTVGPARSNDGTAATPDTLTPAGGQDGASADPGRSQPPVQPTTLSRPARGSPDAQATPAQTETVDPVSPVPQQNSAAAAMTAPTPSVAETPEPGTIPIAPQDSETTEPLQPLAAETDAARGSDLAVAVSPRPRMPDVRPSTEPQGEADGSGEQSALLFPPLMESPLETYMRGQGDPNFRQQGAQAGGSAFQGSRGPGNSDVTNYAGEVLMHLNRSPAVRVSGRGFARVFFQIDPDGSLAWVDVIDSSGSQAIDRAAKAQIRGAAPFPRPPGGQSRKLAFFYRIE